MILPDDTNYLSPQNILLHTPYRKTESNYPKFKTYQQPEILFINTYPPRECGLATYSQDLIKAMNNKFNQSFTISICALESSIENHAYTEPIKFILNTDQQNGFRILAEQINNSDEIEMVVLQHEFGLFRNCEKDFTVFLTELNKPLIVVFHTILPEPTEVLLANVQAIARQANAIIVMTNTSAKILSNEYQIMPDKITVIAHGTHLVTHPDKDLLKIKYGLTGKTILTTFGLLSEGKSIETTLEALPAIILEHPDILFLILGKTHPSVIKQEGFRYRNMLDAIVVKLHLQEHVKYINYYLPLPELLEYLQLTDIYLFTSKDPNQAVSGTFSYALSCGCPIISTPIPHALEVLGDDGGLIFNFGNAEQLSEAVNHLLKDDIHRNNIRLNGLHQMAPTAWENAAIAHSNLFEKILNGKMQLKYKLPEINMTHFKNLTTQLGMIQFSNIHVPDVSSGYTLDDNARALIAMCQHYELLSDEKDLQYINKYLNFIEYCVQPDYSILNYVDELGNFTDQNNECNLSDAYGRAIWALGFLISKKSIIPEEYTLKAHAILQKLMPGTYDIHSPRAMAFVIKGLYYKQQTDPSTQTLTIIRLMANRLLQMYRHESDKDWQWFESYLTYANSILPEAMLCAWLATGASIYKAIARSSFDFLLSKTFTGENIQVISNKTWLHKSTEPASRVHTNHGGEQPIDVSYTVMALYKFFKVFQEDDYREKMFNAFNWFLGNNHLHRIIYNPCTGGCYDGLEKDYVNLNQGAESTISYLMARLIIEKQLQKENIFKMQQYEIFEYKPQEQFV